MLHTLEVQTNERAIKMLSKIKQIYKNYQAEKLRRRFLEEKLEGLTDYGFLDRATNNG